MAEAKTQPTRVPLADFLATLPDAARRADCETLAQLMQQVTGEPPVMWGSSIVGFGRYRQRYANGKEADWPVVGFSPRKNDLTLYLMEGFEDCAELLARLGRHKTSKACLYLKSLKDVDPSALRELVERSVAYMEPRRVRD